MRTRHRPQQTWIYLFGAIGIAVTMHDDHLDVCLGQCVAATLIISVVVFDSFSSVLSSCSAGFVPIANGMTSPCVRQLVTKPIAGDKYFCCSKRKRETSRFSPRNILIKSGFFAVCEVFFFFFCAVGRARSGTVQILSDGMPFFVCSVYLVLFLVLWGHNFFSPEHRTVQR